MNKKTMFSTLVLLASLAGGAQASTTALPDPRIAERLACLQRPAAKPDFPARHKYDGRRGMLRVKLRFEPNRAKPKIEVLYALADASMQELAFDYLEAYRLPCLQEGDPPIEAVQEMEFSPNPDPEPMPLVVGDAADPCVVMPREGPDYRPVMSSSRIQHVIAHARFDTAEAPEVRFLYSTGDSRAEQAVKEYLVRYRMPCRKAGDPPFEFEQSFHLDPGNATGRHVLTRTELGLREFLGMVKNVDKLTADFDLNTMACPFKLAVNLRQPLLPNAVSEIGRPDPNRLAFLRWLSQLPMNWRDPRQENELFNSRINLTIPCGVVRLNPPPSPQGVSS